MKKTRIDESREALFKAFLFALGSYTEQEATKNDQWRQSIGQLYDHLKHELEEIKSNLRPPKDQLTYLIHNCCDAVTLSAMLLYKAMEMNKLKEE